MVSLVLLTGLFTLSFDAKNAGMLLAGQLLCGIPFGCLNVIARELFRVRALMKLY